MVERTEVSGGLIERLETMSVSSRDLVGATGKTAESRPAVLWQRHANTNRRSMMTDRRGTLAPWTRRVHIGNCPSVRPIADAVPFGIIFSCAANVPIEPGRWPQRSRPEAVGGQRTEEGRATCWLNLSKSEPARFTKSDLNSLRLTGLGFGEECNRNIRFTGHNREISTETGVGDERDRNRVLALRAG